MLSPYLKQTKKPKPKVSAALRDWHGELAGYFPEPVPVKALRQWVAQKGLSKTDIHAKIA